MVIMMVMMNYLVRRCTFDHHEHSRHDENDDDDDYDGDGDDNDSDNDDELTHPTSNSLPRPWQR